MALREDIFEAIKEIKDPKALGIIQHLLEEINFLQKEVKELRQESKKLKEEISNLKKDSSTSSKPPSSDISKPRSERRKEGKRKIGGQKGSKREFKKKFSEEEIDKFCDLKLDSCPACENKNLKSIAARSRFLMNYPGVCPYC